MSDPVEIRYPCGCVEYIGVTDKDGHTKQDIQCEHDLAREMEVVKGIKDSEKIKGEKEVKTVWDCARKNQREEPIGENAIIVERSGQVVQIKNGKKEKFINPTTDPMREEQ